MRMTLKSLEGIVIKLYSQRAYEEESSSSSEDSRGSNDSIFDTDRRIAQEQEIDPYLIGIRRKQILILNRCSCRKMEGCIFLQNMVMR